MADGQDSGEEEGRSSFVRAVLRLLIAVAVPVVLIGGAAWYVAAADRLDAAVSDRAAVYHEISAIVLDGAATPRADGLGVTITDPLAVAARVETLLGSLAGTDAVQIVNPDGTIAFGEASGVGLSDLDRAAFAGLAVGETERTPLRGSNAAIYSVPWAPSGSSTVAVVRIVVEDDETVRRAVADTTRLQLLFGSSALALTIALVPTCWWSLGRLRRHLRRTRRLAVRDSLTGLANRSHFHDRLDEAVAAADRSGSRVGLVVLDLDGFKAINDTGGHGAGDRLLKRVAATLEGATRRNELACRLGGDEFAVIVPAIDGREDLVQLAERLHEELDVEVGFTDGRALRVTASIGLAVFPDDAQTSDDLITVADVAMYNVKAARLAKLPPGAHRRTLVR